MVVENGEEERVMGDSQASKPIGWLVVPFNEIENTTEVTSWSGKMIISSILRLPLRHLSEMSSGMSTGCTVWSSEESSELKIKLGVLGIWTLSEALRVDEVNSDKRRLNHEEILQWGELANTWLRKESEKKQKSIQNNMVVSGRPGMESTSAGKWPAEPNTVQESSKMSSEACLGFE